MLKYEYDSVFFVCRKHWTVIKKQIALLVTSFFILKNYLLYYWHKECNCNCEHWLVSIFYMNKYNTWIVQVIVQTGVRIKAGVQTNQQKRELCFSYII